jgi:hypothetical protein
VWKDRLGLVRVLDVNTDVSRAVKNQTRDPAPGLCSSLSNLKILRRCPQEDWPFPIEPPTIVDVVTRDRWHGEKTGSFGAGSILENPRKYVAHIRYDPCYEGLQYDGLAANVFAENAVFIVSPIGGPGHSR